MVPLVMALVCSVRAIPEETPLTRQSHNRGSFTNYVDKCLAFFDHLPTFIVDIVIRIKIICISLTFPVHTVAIWTFTFHKISGFVRVILKANFKQAYRPGL